MSLPTTDPLSDEPQDSTCWSGDDGARRLLAVVRDACAEAEGLPSRFEAGLRAALEMLADDPDLAYVLIVAPHLSGDEQALAGQRQWIRRLADLMRDAAASDPRVSPEPAFLAPFLIDGVRLQIGRLLLNDEAPDLLRLLPGALEQLLDCYFKSRETYRLARAAIVRRR